MFYTLRRGIHSISLGSLGSWHISYLMTVDTIRMALSAVQYLDRFGVYDMEIARQNMK